MTVSIRSLTTSTLTLSTLTLCMLTLSGCGQTSSSPTTDAGSTSSTTQSLTLVQGRFPSFLYAGEVIATQQTAAKNNLSLSIIEGSENINPISLVQAGEYDVGIVGASMLMTAIDNGADLVAIGAVSNKSLTVFASRKELNITTPQGWEGKTMGRLEGAPTDIVYQVMKKKLALTNIKEITAPWDLKSFILGQYDIQQAYVNDEPITLAQQGIQVNIIDPNDYGVHFIGDVYFVKRSLIETNPALVQTFITSVAQGWTKAFADTTGAITTLKQVYPSIDLAKDTLGLSIGRSYMAGESGEILYVSEDTRSRMADDLISIGLIKGFDVKKYVDNRFVNAYHEMNR